MLSREEFEAEVVPLRAALEQRHRKYLRYYYAGIAVAILLLATALCSPQAVLSSIQRLFGMHAPLTPSDIMAYRVFAVLCAVLFVLGPVLSYRGQHGFSVERVIYARLLGLFGTFMPVAGGGISSADLRRVGRFASSLLYHPEGGAVGEMNGLRIRMCDCLLFKREDRRETLVFKGLLILCEQPPGFNEVNIGEAMAEGAGMPVHAQLETFAQTAGEVSMQKYRWDEKLAYTVAALYARLKETGLSRMGKDELPSEKAYRLKYAIAPRLIRSGSPAAENALTDLYIFEYSSQANLAAIAGYRSLFGLGSLFEPPLDETHTRYLYEVMQCVDALTRHLKTVGQSL